MAQANSQRTIVLRGHHLLCIHGFKGMGYNKPFVHNMAEIVSAIRQGDVTLIPTATVDSICSACPNLGDGACAAKPDSEVRIQGHDRRVLEHLGVTPGQALSVKELFQITRERVRPDDLDQLCATCPWLPYGVCKEGLQRLAAGEAPFEVKIQEPGAASARAPT